MTIQVVVMILNHFAMTCLGGLGIYFWNSKNPTRNFSEKNQHIEGRNAIWGGIMNHGMSKAIKII